MALDFRSMGALCLALPFAMLLQRMPRKQQLLALPVCAVLALSAVGYLYYSRSLDEASAARGTRSDVERAAMLEAAWHGFTRSPFIGNGSWFSKSDVMSEFYALRYAKSLEAGVGSFTEGEEEDVKMVIHSQLLVGLAEGGILGGLFFLAYGAMLFWGLGYCTLGQPWHRYSAIYLFTLLESFWGLGMSPFSGMHRMLIAVATGLVLILWAERAATHRRFHPLELTLFCPCANFSNKRARACPPPGGTGWRAGAGGWPTGRCASSRARRWTGARRSRRTPRWRRARRSAARTWGGTRISARGR